MTHDFTDGVLTLYNDQGDVARYEKNPETQKAFLNEDEALTYAYTHPIYFFTPPTLAEVKRAAKERLAGIRWKEEVGGIVLPDGTEVATTREAQGSIVSAYSSLKEGFIASTPWKGETGWQVVTLEEMAPIAKTVAEHVSLCFAKEEAASAVIDACVSIDEVNTLSLPDVYATTYQPPSA